MIGKLVGHIDGVTPEGAVVLMVGGVGYAVRITASALLSLRARNEKTTTLYIYTAVRDDAIDLYGFEHDEDLHFFKQLLGVSNIGPKTALGILNMAETATLKRAIASGEPTMLTKLFGIGKKSAERLVVELRDKIADELGTTEQGALAESDADVIEALMALGYSALESRKALSVVGKEVEGTKARLSGALKQLGSRASI
jgi:Holliday junction DNA helicase RuvA